MQQNKVLQLAGEKTSVTKQESQLKTQGDARPPLKRKGRCSPAVITWRQEVLIELLLETFTGLKNNTFKGSFSLFLPNKKAARSLVQETCPHRHHTRRQGVFFLGKCTTPTTPDTILQRGRGQIESQWSWLKLNLQQRLQVDGHLLLAAVALPRPVFSHPVTGRFG